jgi:hypothetical protein
MKRMSMHGSNFMTLLMAGGAILQVIRIGKKMIIRIIGTAEM